MSESPVPYTIVAYQSDGANTASSVFMTGQRAHKQNSVVTRCTGDEPVGLGVKSNTVSSVCHRKGHSKNVRIEGQWATRHGNEWWMNNRNTVEKLVWPKHNLSYDPTPPIQHSASPGNGSAGQNPGYFADMLVFTDAERGIIREAQEAIDNGSDPQEVRRWAREQIEAERQRVEEETHAAPIPNTRTEGNVSVKGRRRCRRNCGLRKYQEGCADALPYTTPHHVVPDRAFRTLSGTLYRAGCRMRMAQYLRRGSYSKVFWTRCQRARLDSRDL